MTWNLYILLVWREGCSSHLNACCKEKRCIFFPALLVDCLFKPTSDNCAAGIEHSGNPPRGMWALVCLGVSSRKLCVLPGTRLHYSWAA